MGLVITGVARADHAADRATELKAREDFAAGRYHQALDTFAKLYAETLNPVYLRNIGRCHQKLHNPENAIDSFREYLAKGKTISADERAEINGYIKEMEALRATQQSAAAPPPAPPVEAPAPPPPVQPIAPAEPANASVSAGPALAPAPPPPATEHPTASGGTLVAQPAPPPAESPPLYARWWFWTIVGAVALGGAAAAVVALGGGTTKPTCSSPGLDVLQCK